MNQVDAVNRNLNVVDHPRAAALAPTGRCPAQLSQSMRATDYIPCVGRRQQEALQGSKLVVRPVLLSKADEGRELNEDHARYCTLLAYTRQA